MNTNQYQISITDIDNCETELWALSRKTGIEIHERICETVYLASGHILDAMDENTIPEIRIAGFEITMEWA